MSSRKRYRRLALLSLLSCIVGKTFVFASSRNPYTILGVSRTASQKEIQKAYRQQCLRLHPDKNTHRSLHERERCEILFKQVQQAYSMIGDEEERRSYDLHERYGPFTGSGMNRARSDSAASFGGPRRRTTTTASTTGDPTMDDFFRFFTQSGPSVFFTQEFDGRPRFGVRTAFPTGPATDFVASGLSLKSIYKQKVQVPLEQLYTGVVDMEFTLVDNLWLRWRAAIRGKIVYVALYQGMLYSMPIIRTNKIVAAIVGLFIAHITLPKPDPTQSYISTLPKGTKVSSVRFRQNRNDQPEVIFEIQEAPHKCYRREGDNLWTFVKITSSEAERGCTKEIPPLDPNQSPILLSIPPNTTPDDELCLRGMGWPTGNEDSYGDLFVRIIVQKDRVGKREGRRRR